MSRLDHCYNIADLRNYARRRLPKGVFEYIDRGAEDEVTLTDNREAFKRLKLRTRFLVDLSDRDMGIDLLGGRSELPMAIAPTGAAGLTWYHGEVELAKAAAAKGVPFTLATPAVTPMERVAEVAGGRLWFQLYMWGEVEESYKLVGRAKEAGFEALVMTIDSALGNNREYNKRNGFTTAPFTPSLRALTDMALHPEWLLGVMGRYIATDGMPRHENYPEKYRHRITRGGGREGPTRHLTMTWDEVARMRDFWPGKLIVKGILREEDAVLAVENGADAVVVSNHGGRALDSAAPTMEILPEVVRAVGARTTVILDSGIRRGSEGGGRGADRARDALWHRGRGPGGGGESVIDPPYRVREDHGLCRLPPGERADARHLRQTNRQLAARRVRVGAVPREDGTRR
jgi:isopentenyl diphosphate isomerase/L-lactate dehydrogenase-like FMN-dependent dehydrogenase